MSQAARRSSSGPEPPGGPGLPPAPVAPTLEEWAALSAEEQRRLAEELTVATNEYLTAEQALEPPEGDSHVDAWVEARETLHGFYGRSGPRGTYIATNMSVLYPGRVGVAPDLFAVTDVELRRRESWIVHVEGKGPDLAMEFCHSGDRDKDFVRNVQRYAELGIREYFAVDLRRGHLRGWRLPAGGRSYQPVLPQAGRYASEVLGLELVLIEGRLRFLRGSALLQNHAEMVAFLGQVAEAERARAEEERARAEEERSRASAALQEALLLILRARGLMVSEEERARIQAIADAEELRRCIARAGEARDVAAVLEDRDVI